MQQGVPPVLPDLRLPCQPPTPEQSRHLNRLTPTGGKPIGVIGREDIKTLIASMHRKGLSASRIGCAHLVISAVLAEAVRDKKLAESPAPASPSPASSSPPTSFTHQIYGHLVPSSFDCACQQSCHQPSGGMRAESAHIPPPGRPF